MALLNKLKRDKSYLTDVLHGFGWICQVIKGISNQDLRNYLITKLEKRWLAWKQPLLLLSFLLYSFNKFLCSILCELKYYKNEEYLFNRETFDQFGGNLEKVLAISQIRSELIHSQNIVTIDKSLKIYKQTIAIPLNNQYKEVNSVEYILGDDHEIDNTEKKFQADIDQLNSVDD
ncbi:9972_t:CDS:2 [Cetraspora pellucida]|uniref:9972_t:CDS:1 n=1 Tax=Cetraspora pellucida TaxID=1433469 RepID=A0ACA9KCP3_9GLOM|nr:9972_t:CDS:2 [Cetraspora pellucida]